MMLISLLLMHSRLQWYSDLAHGGNVPTAAIIIRLPEALTVVYKPVKIDTLNGVFVVFDPQPNPSTKTDAASLIVFPSSESVLGYLLERFYIASATLASMPKSDMAKYTSFTARYFIRNPGWYPDHADHDAYEANLQVLRLQCTLATTHQQTLAAEKETQHHIAKSSRQAQEIRKLRQEKEQGQQATQKAEREVEEYLNRLSSQAKELLTLQEEKENTASKLRALQSDYHNLLNTNQAL
ncbi:hypothetical protein SISSUDRAFT_443133 [Sistotremastrum suecicum HHB10207 ss-3]|uniref:Uncharacterized protein n=1 Tax=Sistotremastrum suecicum HHB10207 ss-3 TaxID=1314776 RepID=A0A165YCS9_9AGAM|nr:hypothetical protein SISSUDRAFT_443133 [Sistotremastrum suecicum HHB10207 ss-3]